MGDAYEILLKKFADDSKAQAGEFYTPRSVVRLLIIFSIHNRKLYMIPFVVVEECLSKLYDICTMILFCCGSIFGQEKNVVNAPLLNESIPAWCI